MVFLSQVSVEAQMRSYGILELEGTFKILSLILEMRKVMLQSLCDLLRVTVQLSDRIRIYTGSLSGFLPTMPFAC